MVAKILGILCAGWPTIELARLAREIRAILAARAREAEEKTSECEPRNRRHGGK